MNVSKAEYEVLKTMTDDLMKAEEVINHIGVETRCGEGMDEFRPTIDVLRDISIVIKNNPTILEDVNGFDPSTSDELVAFLSKYDLSGITKVSF